MDTEGMSTDPRLIVQDVPHPLARVVESPYYLVEGSHYILMIDKKMFDENYYIVRYDGRIEYGDKTCLKLYFLYEKNSHNKWIIFRDTQNYPLVCLTLDEFDKGYKFFYLKFFSESQKILSKNPHERFPKLSHRLKAPELIIGQQYLITHFDARKDFYGIYRGQSNGLFIFDTIYKWDDHNNSFGPLHVMRYNARVPAGDDEIIYEDPFNPKKINFYPYEERKPLTPGSERPGSDSIASLDSLIGKSTTVGKKLFIQPDMMDKIKSFLGGKYTKRKSRNSKRKHRKKLY